MNIEAFREYCLSKKGVTESFPFDHQTLVFKVKNKMFALCDVDEFESINLKCDPERALALRTEYKEITPGFHMNKSHWNTILVNGSVPDKLFRELIDHSYDLVVQKLSKKEKEELN